MPMVHVIFCYILVGLQKGWATFKNYTVNIFTMAQDISLHKINNKKSNNKDELNKENYY